MRYLLSTAALVAFSVSLTAQDKITLANGDVITGKITSMADGKITIKSPLLDDVTVPIANVSDMSTGGSVRLKTKSGDLLPRRIVGIEGGSLRLEGGDTSTLALDNLGMINPPEKPGPKWTGSLKFVGIQTSGNTDRRSAGLYFEAVRRSEIDRLSVDASWDYAENKAPGAPSGSPYIITQRRAGAGLKYDYFLTDRSYLLVTTRVLGDTIANLDLRWTGGVGVGRTLWDNDKSSFLLEAGLAYYSEDYRVTTPPAPSSIDYLAARIAYRYENQLSEQTKLVHRAEVFPSLEDKEDIYCQVTTEVTTTLTESMVASVSHILDYDNTPAPGFQRADQRIVLSVGWSF